MIDFVDVPVTAEKEDTGWALNAGLLWQPSPGWRLWLRGDRLYRYPAVDEIAGYTDFVLATPFNAELDPEAGWNAELGIETSGNGWSLGLNLFALWMEDEIAYSAREKLNINFDPVRRLGAELSSEVRWRTWRWRTELTLVEAQFDGGEFAGNAIPLVPSVVLSSRLQWEPADFLMLALGWRVTAASKEGDDFANDQSWLPAYHVGEAEVRWEFASDWHLSARVQNLTDERYATARHLGVWYPAAGRTLRLSLRHDF